MVPRSQGLKIPAEVPDPRAIAVMIGAIAIVAPAATGEIEVATAAVTETAAGEIGAVVRATILAVRIARVVQTPAHPEVLRNHRALLLRRAPQARRRASQQRAELLPA